MQIDLINDSDNNYTAKKVLCVLSGSFQAVFDAFSNIVVTLLIQSNERLDLNV